jgi:arylsulfatase A-like enzyme
MRWLANNTNRPFFLFVHYYDNHWDYLPLEPYDSLYDPNYHGDIDGTEIAREPLYSNRPSDEDVTHIIALYDGEIRQTDCDLGEMLTFLKKQGRFEDSLIIVMSDHGQQFYEHGHTSHHGIFDELIRVPLAVSVPDANEHKLINSLVSGVDIMPTILDYAGLPIPVQCRGQSLKSLIENNPANKRDFVFVEYTGGAVPNCFAVRFQNYKFISEKDEIFAYDLADDPSEQRKIYKDKFSTPMNEMFDKIKPLLVQEKSQAK